MSELMESEKKKKTAEKTVVQAPVQTPVQAPVQTVQRDLQDVNGPEGGMLPADVSSRIQSKRGTGQRLSNRQLQNYSQKFGRDMSDVHIHTDVESDTISRSLNARAFTIGSDVFLTKGINPDGGGRDAETMTHELTHVVQQGGHASSGPLKLGAADTSQEHEAEATAQREFEPQAAEADTIQRGFWGSLGSTIGMNLLGSFGMGGAVDAFSDFMSGDQKVKTAIEKMDAGQRDSYKVIENRIKTLESGELDAAEREVAAKQKKVKKASKPGSGIDSAQAVDEAKVADEDYEKLKAQYQTCLNTQLEMLQKVDETITRADVNRYRSGKGKTFVSSMFAWLGGSILSGFKSDPDEKEKARKQGMNMVNTWFSSANKGQADTAEETEEEKEAKAKEREKKQASLVTSIWQDVQNDGQLKDYYTNWILFKREIAKEHSDLIKDSLKDGESDQEIKNAVIESLKRKAKLKASNEKPSAPETEGNESETDNSEPAATP